MPAQDATAVATSKRKPGRPKGQQNEPPDERRCPRVVAMQTGGKWDLWRCGRRIISKAVGFCEPHRYVADASLRVPPPTSIQLPGRED